MFRIYNKIRKTGVVTEPLKPAANTIAELGQACQKEIARKFSGSLAIRMVDAGSCNG